MELTPQIPIIDISVWSNHGERESEAARSCVAKEWNAALVEFGCAVIVGHGIDERIFRKINEESSTFFCSSIESKLRYNYGSYGHPCGGYTAPGNEIVAMSSEQMDDAELNGSKPKYDPVENFVFTTLPRNFVSPCGDPAPFDSAADYYQIMENTLTILHRLSCAALGMSDLNYFEQFYDASLPGNERKGRNGNCLRLAHYPPIDVSMVKEQACSTKDFDKKVRYGAHTDYQGFTILRPDKSDWHVVEREGLTVRCGGLEVYHRASKHWIQVQIPSELNALVINAGDLIQRWTNDLWHSPLHRVVTASAMVPLDDDGRDHQVEGSAGAGAGTGNCPSVDTERPAADLDTGSSAGSLSRQAIVFFSGPLEDSMVICIDPALMTAAQQQQQPEQRAEVKYAPIRAGDFLFMKLNKTNSH